MAVQIQFRGGTAAEWEDANPILAIRELGVELPDDWEDNPDSANVRFKFGNGEAHWNDLNYAGIAGPAGEAFVPDPASVTLNGPWSGLDFRVGERPVPDEFALYWEGTADWQSGTCALAYAKYLVEGEPSPFVWFMEGRKLVFSWVDPYDNAHMAEFDYTEDDTWISGSNQKIRLLFQSQYSGHSNNWRARFQRWDAEEEVWVGDATVNGDESATFISLEAELAVGPRGDCSVRSAEMMDTGEEDLLFEFNAQYIPWGTSGDTVIQNVEVSFLGDYVINYPFGPVGATGMTGPSGTIQIYGVVTEDPGTDASVENVGTDTEAQFLFRIPRGDVGEEGSFATAQPTIEVSSNSWSPTEDYAGYLVEFSSTFPGEYGLDDVLEVGQYIDFIKNTDQSVVFAVADGVDIVGAGTYSLVSVARYQKLPSGAYALFGDLE